MVTRLAVMLLLVAPTAAHAAPRFMSLPLTFSSRGISTRPNCW